MDEPYVQIVLVVNAVYRDIDINWETASIPQITAVMNINSVFSGDGRILTEYQAILLLLTTRPTYHRAETLGR